MGKVPDAQWAEAALIGVRRTGFANNEPRPIYAEFDEFAFKIVRFWGPVRVLSSEGRNSHLDGPATIEQQDKKCPTGSHDDTC